MTGGELRSVRPFWVGIAAYAVQGLEKRETRGGGTWDRELQLALCTLDTTGVHWASSIASPLSLRCCSLSCTAVLGSGDQRIYPQIGLSDPFRHRSRLTEPKIPHPPHSRPLKLTLPQTHQLLSRRTIPN